MKTIRSFDVLNAEPLEQVLSRDESTPMLRLYNWRRELTLTAGDLREAITDLEPSAEPMARVLPKRETGLTGQTGEKNTWFQ